MPKPPSRRRRPGPEQPRVSRQHKPDGMTLEEWQTHLRRQFGRSLGYKVRNLGDRPAFSDFLVTNPASGRGYRVTVRGTAPGDNTCSCPDFATNTLGTCKHVEFVLARVERTAAGRRELAAGYRGHQSGNGCETWQALRKLVSCQRNHERSYRLR